MSRYRWARCFARRRATARAIREGRRVDLSFHYFKWLCDRTRISYGMVPTKLKDWLP